MAQTKKIFEENFDEIENRAQKLDTLINLTKELKEREKRDPILFNDFLYLASNNPELVFRDIFQLFHDMMKYYVEEGSDDFPESNDSVGFLPYNTNKLFVDDCDNPFFADRIFANRLMNLIDSFKQGTFHNYIFLFEGPPGSGKSTFLNNVLQKLEDYTRTNEGALYKTYWRLNVEQLGGFRRIEKRMHDIAEENDCIELENQLNDKVKYPEKYLEFSCPNHDHPILQIPKSFRRTFLEELIPDEKFKEKLFNDKSYEWILKGIPCHICNSIFKELMDLVKNPKDVFDMISARKNYYDRQLGEGISIFNPGDAIIRKNFVNNHLQIMLNELFKTDDIRFSYSYLAKTNNGVLGLMDIKENNVDRLKNYHGVISDGVHKVELAEERIKTLFMGLVNPEDKVHYEKIKSFQDRIVTVNIPYIMDYETEVNIYKNKFGNWIEGKFLPRVLENFAKIIISTRLNPESPAIRKWILSPDKYSKYLDRNLLLLKMDVYSGKVPDYLTDEDVKRFTKQTRKEILAASDQEGNKGISGRMSLNIFNEFLSKFNKNSNLITMEMVYDYFSRSEKLYQDIPIGFLSSLVDLYNYDVLQEVKEAIYYYNESQINRDIMNYLFFINYEFGDTEKCPYTEDTITVSEEYFKTIESFLLGSDSTAEQRKTFRNDNQKEYITRTVASEINLNGKNISETEQMKNLFDKYTKILKENSLAPYSENETFRRALTDWGSPSFNSYDDRIKRDINLLIKNLIQKFDYSEIGAKEVSIYVLDKKLARRY